MELDTHPDKRTLMTQAFTYKWGKNQGEIEKEQNPAYQQQIKKLSKQIDAAKKKGGKTSIKSVEDSGQVAEISDGGTT